MKFKLDENFSPAIHELFRRRSIDCDTVISEGLGGASDVEVLAAATADGRVLVTLDRDFCNVLRFPPTTIAGIAVESLGCRASRELLAEVIGAFLTVCEKKLLHGKLWILEPGRIREYGGEPDTQDELTPDN